MNNERLRGSFRPINLCVLYSFPWSTLEAAVGALFGAEAKLELQLGEEPGVCLPEPAGELPDDDETSHHLGVLLTYLHEQFHVSDITGSPIGLLLYVLGGRQYAYILKRLQAFGHRVAEDQATVPTMPMLEAHSADENIAEVAAAQAKYALYHALFMGDMSDVTFSTASKQIFPHMFRELEAFCQGALGLDEMYPPVVTAGLGDELCSIGGRAQGTTPLTGGAVLEGLARMNEYLTMIHLGAPQTTINRYLILKEHGVYGVTRSWTEYALGLSPPHVWKVVALLSDWALQAPVLPFLLSGRPDVMLPELLPAWRFLLLLLRWRALHLPVDDIGDRDLETELFESLGWESPHTIAGRILSMPPVSSSSPLTRLHMENLRLAATIRLDPGQTDKSFRLGSVYNVFSDGMRLGTSGRFSTDKDTWQIPLCLIDDAVIDALLLDQHFGRPMAYARLFSDLFTEGRINPGEFLGRSLRGILGQQAACRLLEHNPTTSDVATDLSPINTVFPEGELRFRSEAGVVGERPRGASSGVAD